MRNRNWSIRSRIIALGAVPVSALLALWIFATVLTIGPVINLLSMRTVLDTIRQPGETLIAELQHERRLSVLYLSAGSDGTALGAQRTRTDKAANEFRRAAGGDAAREAADAAILARIDRLFIALEVLPPGRGFIDRRDVDIVGALGLYNGIIESAFRLFNAAATFNDPDIDREIRALTSLGRARELLSQTDAVLAAAMARGRFDPDEYARLVQIIGTQRYLYAESVAELPEQARTSYQELTLAQDMLRLREMQDAVLAEGRADGPVPVSVAKWDAAYRAAVPRLRAFESGAIEALTERTDPFVRDILLRLGYTGLLGLAALAISVLVAVRIGRSLVGRLAGLRAAALAMAEERLPDVVRRLRRGENVDVAVETPVLSYGGDEIGQLGNAFTEVQRTAVQSAVDEARVRRGMNEVFLNIARRSQALLHRQLALLDRMERRASEPQELEDLYRVDHLATRMRRHAEDLVILAGATPGRGWRNPVPMVDVIRGAISEVEDYQRIDVGSMDNTSLVGRAVGDLIHLLAELLENAASFSPPHTRVHVVGQLLPNGYAIEVEDRGLGMTPEAMAAVNARLIEPPQFDPADSARLGLFVVAQLGARHGVTVQLRPSPYGGVTAVALIPGKLVTPGGHPAALAAAPAVDPTGEPAATAELDPPAAAELDPAAAAELDRAATAAPTGPGSAAPVGPQSATETTGPGPDLPVRRRTPPHPQSEAVPATEDTTPAWDSPTEDGLPRRTRQASLAAQLRRPSGERAGTEPSGARPPEQVRSMMSSLQAGTRRGRQDAAQQADPSRRPGPSIDGPPLRPPAEVVTGVHLTFGGDRPRHLGDDIPQQRQPVQRAWGGAGAAGRPDADNAGRSAAGAFGRAADDMTRLADASTAGYPLTSSASSPAAAPEAGPWPLDPAPADGVVHHGEILPPSRMTRSPAELGRGQPSVPPPTPAAGTNDQPDKDA